VRIEASNVDRTETAIVLSRLIDRYGPEHRQLELDPGDSSRG
jgi:hypothetical protein